MELSEALAISFINAAIISILLLILYTINIKKRKIEVFGPYLYLFKLEESGELKEVTEPPPEVSEALGEVQKKLERLLLQEALKRFEERFKPIDRWYNIAIITIIIFIVTFIVQLIIFLHI